MKLFFRKHGNSVFYIVLPLFFLILTFAFIEFTPRQSSSTPGASCENGEPCCNSLDPSLCGENADELCNKDTLKCVSTNVGCPDPPGGVPNQNFEPGTCLCLADANDRNSVVTNNGNIPDGTCTICDPDQMFDSIITQRCVLADTVNVQGTGCSLSSASVGTSYSGMFGLGYLLYAFFIIRFRKKD